MDIVELDEQSCSRIVVLAEHVIRTGGVAICPTDTVYGILGDAACEKALARIFGLKHRTLQKAFPVFVEDIAMARHYAYISDAKARFLERVWPGAVTVVFRHKEKLPSMLTGGLDTIGLRMPDDPFLLMLLERFGAPIMQTSANISKQPAAHTIEEVQEYFGNADIKPDLIINGGVRQASPSTVLDFSGNNPMILRTGILSKEQLDDLIRSMI